jgi:hypothetical protein
MNSENPFCYPRRRLPVFPLLLIAIGAAAILARSGLVAASRIEALWPLALVLFAVEQLGSRRPAKRAWAALFVLGGVVATLMNLGYVHWDARRLEPLGLIALGLVMLAGRVRQGART